MYNVHCTVYGLLYESCMFHGLLNKSGCKVYGLINKGGCILYGLWINKWNWFMD